MTRSIPPHWIPQYISAKQANKETFPPCRKCREPFCGCPAMWGYTLEMARLLNPKEPHMAWCRQHSKAEAGRNGSGSRKSTIPGSRRQFRYPWTPRNMSLTSKGKRTNSWREAAKSRKCPAVGRMRLVWSLPGRTAGGYLYRLRSVKPGLPAITVKTKDKTAGFRASLGCKLDTHTYRCKAGQAYQFLSHSVKKPDIDPGDVNVVEVTYSGQDKRGHLFTLQAKKPGTAVITASLGGMKDTLEVEVEA